MKKNENMISKIKRIMPPILWLEVNLTIKLVPAEIGFNFICCMFTTMKMYRSSLANRASISIK